MYAFHPTRRHHHMKYGNMFWWCKPKILLLATMLFFFFVVYISWLHVHQVSDFGILKQLSPKHPLVLEHIRTERLIPPSKLPYNLTHVSDTYPSPMLQEIRDSFRGVSNGFFVECGAHDGEFWSSSLDLEVHQGWTGLLVEAHPQLADQLATKHRRAWVGKFCLSPYNNVSEIMFSVPAYQKRDFVWQDAIAKLRMPDDTVEEKYHEVRNMGKVPCFPLASVLAAINVKKVDFLSLDVEGVEMKILKTLPFDQSLVIQTILVESKHSPEGKETIKTFLTSKGYRLMWIRGADYFFKLAELPSV